jgi:hypothetical protein
MMFLIVPSQNLHTLISFISRTQLFLNTSKPLFENALYINRHHESYPPSTTSEKKIAPRFCVHGVNARLFTVNNRLSIFKATGLE